MVVCDTFPSPRNPGPHIQGSGFLRITFPTVASCQLTFATPLLFLQYRNILKYVLPSTSDRQHVCHISLFTYLFGFISVAADHLPSCCVPVAYYVQYSWHSTEQKVCRRFYQRVVSPAELRNINCKEHTLHSLETESYRHTHIVATHRAVNQHNSCTRDDSSHLYTNTTCTCTRSYRFCCKKWHPKLLKLLQPKRSFTCNLR